MELPEFSSKQYTIVDPRSTDPPAAVSNCRQRAQLKRKRTLKEQPEEDAFKFRRIHYHRETLKYRAIKPEGAATQRRFKRGIVQKPRTRIKTREQDPLPGRALCPIYARVDPALMLSHMCGPLRFMTFESIVCVSLSLYDSAGSC